MTRRRITSGLVLVAGMMAGRIAFGADEQEPPAQQMRAAGPDPSQATRDAPFVNSLGMRFVPVPETRVLLCVWETRVKDFAAFHG